MKDKKQITELFGKIFSLVYIYKIQNPDSLLLNAVSDAVLKKNVLRGEIRYIYFQLIGGKCNSTP